MEKKYIDDISIEEKAKLRNILINIKSLHEQLRETLFVIDDEGDAIEEKLRGADDLNSIFNLWIKGENLECIGEVIYQNDEEPVRKIFEAIGMTDFD